MEIWKDIPWYEWLYQVSSLWRIKTLWKWNSNISKKERILKWWIANWYKRVTLFKNNKRKQFSVHRLVWLAFIKNINNEKCINHINWIKSDNRVENLEWISYSWNTKHLYEKLWYINHNKWKKLTWAYKYWKNNHSSKKVLQKTLDWKVVKIWNCVKDISKELWFCYTYITNTCRWNRPKAYWYLWEYI